MHLSLSIGPSLIVVASARDHYMKVYYKNRLFGRWPISTGRPGDDTPDGTYLTTFKNNPQRMIGPGYDLLVPWSVDFTYSGDFIHDAYWSVGVQGFANVSHGCINTSPAHAETYYKMAEPGDPVTVTGSPAAGTTGNGWTEWFLSWPQWLRGSATGEAVEAGPTGSSLVSPASLPATCLVRHSCTSRTRAMRGETPEVAFSASADNAGPNVCLVSAVPGSTICTYVRSGEPPGTAIATYRAPWIA